MPRYYKSYFEHHNDSAESIRAAKEFIRATLDTHAAYPADKNARILDVGGGAGRFMMTLRDLGFANIMGVDCSKPMIESAKRQGLDVRLEDAFEFLGKKGENFDAIYLFDLFEHIPVDREIELMKLVRSRLSENGFVYVQTPNAMCPTATFFRYIAQSHFTSFTPHTLAGIFRVAGFEFFDFRPHLQETKEVQNLKLPWARMYRQEYLINDFILTPNIIAVIFNSKKAFGEWEKRAPEIHNDYLEPEPAGQNIAPSRPRGLKRLWRRIRTGRL
ncbi:MAG: class I SAM-dependent methyltransferase [Rickettsiales bacterium]|jgi:2-polyprenyl-3-methyl-5-hydroxy-6-metoxy-1,4-benzoquinol methylase|nr:class I SAM-dependent methyltransferase [Rickettsiales bacterium]